MKFAFIAIVCASLASVLVAEQPKPSLSAVQVEAQARSTVSQLVDRGILDSPEEWVALLTADRKCDGAKVATLLVKLASSFKPVTTADEAISVLMEHGIITSREYWTKNAVAGRMCDAEIVLTVLGRVAGTLPVPRPKSADAAPLKPIAPADVKGAYDVVIAGAGTGGCGAAIQAARMGCSVLLLEETDWIGGQMNAAAVTSMDEGVTLVRERGLYRELCGNISAHYKPLGIDPITAYDHHHYCVEPRVGRQILHSMLGDARGAGVLDLLERSHVIKVLKSGETVTGVEVESVSVTSKESHTVQSKVLVDATEWGDVIPLTAARYRSGNSISGTIDLTREIQSITWTAVVRQYPDGVPPELTMTAPPPGYDAVEKHFESTLQLGKPGELGKNEKGTPWTWERFIDYRGMPDSAGAGNTSRRITRTHLNYNNDYPITVAEIEDPATRLATCRAAIVKTLDLLYYIQTKLGKTDWAVANDEGYDTPYNRDQMDALIAAQPDLKPYRAILYQFPVMAYARESRRIIGLHTLTAHEVERKPGTPVQFPHTVALGDYAVDLHGSMTLKNLELDLDHAEDIPHKFGERGIGPFAIPFECFIPEKVDGFLPAEKNISQSRMANGATRLQPHTLNMGQAVGAIAALAIQGHIQPRAVDPVLVQRVLLDAGCTLSIKPISARWGGAEWKEQQLKMLAGQPGPD